MRKMLVIRPLLLSMLLCQSMQAQNESKESKQRNGKGPTVSNPFLFLLRDPAVQADLQLRDDQKKAVRRLLDELDGPLWLLRDVGPEEGSERLQALIAKARSGLAGGLSQNQLKRLDQIALQAQGPESLLLPGVAQRLNLSNDQRQQIRETVETRRRELTELSKNKVEPGKEQEVRDKAAKVIEAEQEDLLIILTESQKKQWAAMLGKPIDLSKVQAGRIKAPEIVTSSEWINSDPLSFAQLRGRVVAMHFWTFG